MFWREAAEASRSYLHTTCNPITGLAPEYANFNGTPAEPQPHGDFSHFFSDAYRVAANIGLDWAWFQKDSWQVDQCNRIQAFLGISKFPITGGIPLRTGIRRTGAASGRPFGDQRYGFACF